MTPAAKQAREALKKCPFCGSEPSVIDKTERNGKVTVYCDCEVGPSIKGFTLKGTSAAWNLRALDGEGASTEGAMVEGARLALESANRFLEDEGISIDVSADAIIRAHMASQDAALAATPKESKPC